MPIEERIVAWSKQRPHWQQIVLQSVADGRAPSEEALAELIEATVEGKRLPGGELNIGHLLASGADAPPVSLESVSELTHVNALSTNAPLTFPGGSLTIVYGDNGSGKSGYARLLKRIAKSRHNEPVLTDVFRDTRVDEPKANLGEAARQEHTSELRRAATDRTSGRVAIGRSMVQTDLQVQVTESCKNFCVLSRSSLFKPSAQIARRTLLK